MNWTSLVEESQLENIREESQQHPVLIFKHSTRCSISSASLARLERNWKESDVAGTVPYYLDLIANRTVSAKVAATFDIPHQSPQILLISRGECIYDASHFDINFAEIQQQLSGIEA
ncbi:bacillithiol system redox-active protein YtxJ [Arundinibacter roseus]|uniref:Bacillithiol system redox-active protein YtxJ n=1 Tax=Arundinibacter roseus TaxID=2070510 RepID=A0A4R4JYQ2_9BACT|nr:bacillithiol system redox-active protein YtxJ [Arundinibacter roseus]TDB60040.1 bacillithiol system redox-active protein YtxJ [Arundinibacter roseus]